MKHPHPARFGRISRRTLVIAASVVSKFVILVSLLLGAQAFLALVDVQLAMDQAKSTITTALDTRQQMTSASGRAHAQADINVVEQDTSAAYTTLHSSFALNVLGSLPLLHRQREGLSQLVRDVGQTAAIGNGLLHQVNGLSGTTQGLTIPIPRLKSLQASVSSAHDQLLTFDRPSNGLWGPLRSARASFDAKDSKLIALLETGSNVLSYALPLVGGDGPRQYLIAGENDAEMRDQGEVLSVALMHSVNGSFSLDNTGPSDAPLPQPVAVPLPSGTQAIFGSLQPTQLWQSVNATADFPLSGQIMQAMYQQMTGIHVNGVVALDVPTLVSLLRLYGPVSVPGIAQPVTAANASDILLHQLYAQFSYGNQAPRHDDVSAVANAVVHKMKTEHVDLAALAVALAKDVAGRHLLAWDENPSYEALIVDSGGSGAIDTKDSDRTFHLSVQSATAAKLDYYVTTRIRMVVAITKQNDAVVTTYATISNHAPAGQGPSYQLGPDYINSFTPGQYVARIYLWSPKGSHTASGISESGLVLNQTATSVLPQQQQTVNFTTLIPNAVRNGHLSLQLVPQPSLVPAQVSVQIVGGPNWNVVGPSYVTAGLDKTLAADWALTPR